MIETIERPGKVLYQDKEIEVRTNPRDTESHDIYIGRDYFLFQRGCMEQYAEITSPGRLEQELGNYDPSIIRALSNHNISTERFALYLARARIKEEKDYGNHLRGDDSHTIDL